MHGSRYCLVIFENFLKTNTICNSDVHFVIKNVKNVCCVFEK